jgi:hypothetical protein
MEINRLSEGYFRGCNELHEIANRLYEAVHESNGEPIVDPERVAKITANAMREIRWNVDFVRDMAREYHEEASK